MVAALLFEPTNVVAERVLQLLADIEKNMYMVRHDHVGEYLGFVKAVVGRYLFDLLGYHSADRRKGNGGILGIAD